MANQNQKKKTVAKLVDTEKAVTEPIETAVSPAVETVEKPVAKKSIKFDDAVQFNVQSNVYGELFYRNSRNGDMVRWDSIGDVQPLTMGDLREMRSVQRDFFASNWIFIKEVLSEGYEDVTPEDVYQSLSVMQYYQNALSPEHFTDLFRMEEDDIRARVSLLTEGGKTNLIVAANEAIKNGQLDSLRKIRLLEELLKSDLMSPAE